jgi:hypothetical protein
MRRPALALGFAMAFASATVRAEPPAAQDRAMAEALFRDANDLVRKERYAEACPKFAESQRLDPRVGTMLYLATCHEQEGKTATAWLEFSEAAAMAAKARQPDREKTARDRANALEARLSKLTLTLAGPADDVEIKLDARVVGAGALGTAMPVDPGEHTVEASAPKRKAWSQVVKIAGSGTVTVTIPALEVDAPPPPPAPAPLPVAPAADASRRGVPVASLVLGGVAVVGAAGFVYFWLKAGSEANALNRSCAPRCTDDEVSPVRTKFIVADVSLGVGIAAAAGAVLFFVLDRRSPSSPAASVRPGPGGGVVTLEGAF